MYHFDTDDARCLVGMQYGDAFDEHVEQGLPRLQKQRDFARALDFTFPMIEAANWRVDVRASRKTFADDGVGNACSGLLVRCEWRSKSA